MHQVSGSRWRDRTHTTCDRPRPGYCRWWPRCWSPNAARLRSGSCGAYRKSDALRDREIWVALSTEEPPNHRAGRSAGSGRRASIWCCDESSGTLRTVAARGFRTRIDPGAVKMIAHRGRVYRDSGRSLDPATRTAAIRVRRSGVTGNSFLRVPITSRTRQRDSLCRRHEPDRSNRR